MFRSPVTLGANWTDAFRGINGALTATALATALSPIAGSMPTVTGHGDYYEITFDQVQEDRVAEWIKSQLNKEPGPVRVDAGGVATKVIFRQYWPWIVGIAGIGAVLGYYGGKRG